MLTSIAFAQPSQRLANDIPPLAPPLPEMQSTFWERHPVLKFALPGLAAGLALGLWWLWVSRKRTPPQLPDPAFQARAALTALQSRPEDGATLVEVSKILRVYLINRFWLRPEEMTTREFCAALAGNAQIGLELSSNLAEFLRDCDERKFSPAGNTTPLSAASRALVLVEQVEARRAAIRHVGEPPAFRS
jgi:hypothetical protein